MSWTTYTTVNGQILHQDKDGVGTHLIPDTLGNIIATIDEAGTVTSQTEYLPYGEVESQTGTNPTPFGFVGAWGYYSDSNSHIFFGPRFYSPEQSAFESVGHSLVAPYQLSQHLGHPPISGSQSIPCQGKESSLPEEARNILKRLQKCAQIIDEEERKKCKRGLMEKYVLSLLSNGTVHLGCCFYASMSAGIERGGNANGFGFDPCRKESQFYNKKACCDKIFCIEFSTYQRKISICGITWRDIPTTAYSEAAHAAAGKCDCPSYVGPGIGNNGECS